jgi:hypothetical protein
MASDALVVPKGDLSGYLPGLNLAKVVTTQEYLFTKTEMNDILGSLKTRLIAELHIVEADFASHVAMILHRAYFLTTSPKVVFSGQIEYEVGSAGATSKYVLKDDFIFPAINDAGKKYNKSNTIRAFCSSLQDCFLAMAKRDPKAFECKRATRKGAPVGLGYLTADFLTGESSLLNDRERAVMNRSADYALNKPTGSGNDRELVSLYDYGRNS